MLPYWYVLYRDLQLLDQSQHDPAARHRLLQARQRLLRRDLIDFLQPIDSNRPPLIHAAPESDSFMRWRAVMCGPPDTPWRWVTIEMRIEFPPDYPGSAPTITLLTPLFHPNVELETGKYLRRSVDRDWLVCGISVAWTACQPSVAAPGTEHHFEHQRARSTALRR